MFLSQQICNKKFDICMETRNVWKENIYEVKTKINTSSVRYNILTIEKKLFNKAPV